MLKKVFLVFSNVILISAVNLYVWGATESVKHDIKNQSDNEQNMYQKLYDACLIENIDQVKHLIANGVNVNAKNDSGGTVLIYCAWKGYSEIVKILIENGADVNVIDNNGNTALHCGTLMGNNDAIKVLLNNASST